MGRKQELFDHLRNSGHHIHHLKLRKKTPFFSPLSRIWSARDRIQSWEELECNMLCKIAHSGGDYATMRLACKHWRRELNACTYLLAPAVCNAPLIVSLFPNLHQLDLSACNLTVQDESLAALARLPKLEHIDLRGCIKLSANGIRALGNCKSLKRIRVGRDPEMQPEGGATEYDSRISDEMLEALLACKQLESLEVGYSCKCTQRGTLALTQLQNLETLHIMGHSAVDFGTLGREDMLQFAQLKNLKDLRIGLVTAEAFQALPSLSSLTSLDLYGDTWERFQLTASDLATVGQLTGLQHFGLHHFQLVTHVREFMSEETSPVRFLKSLTQLESFQFDDCVVDAGCGMLIIHSCRSIKHVQVKLAAGDDSEDANGGLEHDHAEHILSVMGTGGDWDVEELEVSAKVCMPEFATAALTNAPRIRRLSWDCSKTHNEHSTLWHDCHLDRWQCHAQLEKLTFGNRVRLSPDMLSYLRAFSKLVDLTCTLDSPLPPAISTLQSLENLCITWASEGNAGIALLATLTGLETLHLSCTETVDDMGVAHLSSLSNLSELIFHSANIEPKVSEQGLKALSGLHNLAKLELVSSCILVPSALRALAGLCQLRHLDIGNFHHVDDDVLEALRPLQNLRRMWVRIPKEQMWQDRAKSIQVTKQAMAELAKQHPVMSFICFGNQQMASLPHVAIDRQLLQDLAEAERNGSLDSFEEPFWMEQQEEGVGV